MKPILFLALLLVGCGGGSWQLTEPARTTVSRVSQQDPGLVLEWPRSMPADARGLISECAFVLDQLDANLLELDRRHAQALTEEERSRLAEVRAESIEKLFGFAGQLRALIGWWQSPGTQQLALVFEAEEATRDARGRPIPGSGALLFAHVAVLDPQERPSGPALRQASLPLALRALRDAMVEWARSKGALSPEAREKLGLR